MLTDEQPKKKNRLVYILLVFFLIVILAIAGMGVYFKQVIYQPVSNVDETVSFTISSGERAVDIAENLKSQKLIRNEWVFLGFLKFKDQYSALQAGDYVLNRNYSMIDIVAVLTKGKVVTDKITIPEGWTIDQIREELVNRSITTGQDFDTALAEEYENDFLKEKPAVNDLQGFLFPDTYFLSSRPDAQEVIEKMLSNFSDKADTVLSEGTKTSDLNYYEILTLASIVEKEVSEVSDRRIVAGIFLNRLGIDMPLQSCATVQYVLKNDKRILSQEDIDTVSPYNTYLNNGLPPGPIANPGLDAINSVLNPQETDYLYFFTGNDGKTYFSYTSEEHERKKELYLY